MIKFEFLRLNIGTVILRFYLIMAVVILGGFTGNWWISLLALPLVLSAMLAVKVKLDLSKFKGSKKIKEINSNISNSKAV